MGQDLLGVVRTSVTDRRDHLGVVRGRMKKCRDLLGVVAMCFRMLPVRFHLAQDLLGVVRRWVAFRRNMVQETGECTPSAARVEYEVAQVQRVP